MRDALLAIKEALSDAFIAVDDEPQDEDLKQVVFDYLTEADEQIDLALRALRGMND